MAGAVIKTRLVLTIVNVGLTLFTSVARFAGAQKVGNEVCAVRVASTGIGIAFVNFWRLKRRHKISILAHANFIVIIFFQQSSAVAIFNRAWWPFNGTAILVMLCTTHLCSLVNFLTLARRLQLFQGMQRRCGSRCGTERSAGCTKCKEPGQSERKNLEDRGLEETTKKNTSKTNFCVVLMANLLALINNNLTFQINSW